MYPALTLKYPDCILEYIYPNRILTLSWCILVYPDFEIRILYHGVSYVYPDRIHGAFSDPALYIFNVSGAECV